MHKFVGAVCNLRTNGLRDTVMSRLRRLNCLCSSKESGTAYRFRHGSTLCSPTEEKILCRSPFRSGRQSLVCARLSNNRKLEFQEDRNLGVYPFGPQAKGWLPLPLREDADSPSGGLPMHHNINDDRCTKQGCYGADTQLCRCKHRPRDEIAQQAESRTAEKARRYHQDRLCRAEQAFRN